MFPVRQRKRKLRSHIHKKTLGIRAGNCINSAYPIGENRKTKPQVHLVADFRAIEPKQSNGLIFGHEELEQLAIHLFENLVERAVNRSFDSYGC